MARPRRVPPARRGLFGLAAAATAIAAAIAVVLTATDVGDRLPLPWRPSRQAPFPAASACAECHPTEVAQWRGSAHARSARNPLVHASICGRCHAPLGTMLDPEYLFKASDQLPMPEIPSSAAEGVSCVVCHARTRVPDQQILTFEPEWPNWRTTDLALEILPFDKALGAYGTGADDDPSPVANQAHSSRADPKISSARLCRPCHNVVVDKSPLTPDAGPGPAYVRLLTTFDEWAASPYAQTGETCQSCHMPRHPQAGPSAVAPPGTAYEAPLPARPLADHTFTGVSSEYLTVGPEVDGQEERAAALLRGAATVKLQAPRSVTPGGTLGVTVTVANTGAGHELPTGFANWSEAWIEVLVADATGRVLLASGDLDEAGWLRDEFNPRVRSGALAYDTFLVSLRARLVTVSSSRAAWRQPDGTLRIPPAVVPRNLNGTPILGTADFAVDSILQQLHPGTSLPVANFQIQEGYILRFADAVLRNGIPAQESREAHYRAALDPGVRGPVDVSARLLVRSLWPWMLQQQEELPTPRPRPRIYEIAAAEDSVAVAGDNVIR